METIIVLGISFNMTSCMPSGRNEEKVLYVNLPPTHQSFPLDYVPYTVHTKAKEDVKRRSF